MSCRTILATGTSADAQLKIYQQTCDRGADGKRSLAAVNEWLADTTLERDQSDLLLPTPKAEPRDSCAVAKLATRPKRTVSPDASTLTPTGLAMLQPMAVPAGSAQGM
jgi:hypothetical protein